MGEKYVSEPAAVRVRAGGWRRTTELLIDDALEAAVAAGIVD
jgi:hypothetical protein